VKSWGIGLGRTLWTGLRIMLVFTLVLGVVYPLVITGIGQLFFPGQANGSLLKNAAGQVVGSKLIGQSFADADGNPLPQYFQPRPSAAGDGYDAANSSGTNQGPENPDLIAAIQERRAQIATFNGVTPEQVPPDALTASASGLDPDISPEYARLQIDRVARARNLPRDAVAALVEEYTSAPDLGYIGQTRVNVTALNLALDEYPG